MLAIRAFLKPCDRQQELGAPLAPTKSSEAYDAAMPLIDTHTHLDFPDFDADRAELLARSRALGVERLVVLGVYRANWQRLWDLVQREDGLYAAFGLHPVYLDEHHPPHLDELRAWLTRLAGHPRLCAVGEFGLDYYVEGLDRGAQQALFEAQLRLAAEFELPVLLHVRRAHAATIATLKRIRLKRAGIIHAFAGSAEEAREYMKLGFRLGLGGAPTWPQANRLRKVVAGLPLEAVVLETDAPDMAPAMHPQQRNSPEYLPEICAELARLMGIAPEELAAASSANARALFGWRG
ncbi:putative metal-dependent hydrolase YjjV [compost metagenome]